MKLGRTLTIFFFTALALLCSSANPALAQYIEERKVIESSKVVRSNNWQHGLVEREQNLGNFFWMPQSKRIDSKMVLTRRTPIPAQPVKKFHYIKPAHIATPIPDRASSSSSDTNGRLIQPDVSAQVSVPTKVANYGSDYSSGSRTQSQSSGLLSSKSVHGQVRLPPPAKAPKAARAVARSR